MATLSRANGRNVISASTPHQEVFSNFFIEDKEPSGIELPTAPKMTKASFLEMVIDAIKAIGVPRKGASYQAIKKWIIAKNGENTLLNHHLKLAVKKGIDSGILQRPHKSESRQGAIGSFMLAPTAKSSNKITKKAGKQVVKKSSNENIQSAVKIAGKVVKKALKKEPKSSSEDKKTSTKVLKKSTKPQEGKKPEAKVPAKATKAQKAVPKPGKVDLQSEEPASSISKKKVIANKQKTEIKDTVKSKTKEATKDVPVTKKGKGKATKETKKQANVKIEHSPKPGSSQEQNNVEPKKARSQRAKKLYTSLEAINKADFSDTEIKPKLKNRMALKSYSSDTELEISMRAEKVFKKITKVKKMPSKTKD